MAKFTTDSKFLSHSDISDVEDTIVTIKSYDRETMGQGAQQQEKWVLYFRELKKGLGLNKTNGKILCHICGSDDMDEWIGQKIALYVKDDVEFQGEIVSAIRVRNKLPVVKKAEEKPKAEKADSGVNDLITKLNLSESTKEVMALIRQIALAECSEEDREAMNVLADQRMDEIKQAVKA